MCGCHSNTKLPRTMLVSKVGEGVKQNQALSLWWGCSGVWGGRLDTPAFFPPPSLRAKGMSHEGWLAEGSHSGGPQPRMLRHACSSISPLLRASSSFPPGPAPPRSSLDWMPTAPPVPSPRPSCWGLCPQAWSWTWAQPGISSESSRKDPGTQSLTQSANQSRTEEGVGPILPLTSIPRCLPGSLLPAKN